MHKRIANSIDISGRVRTVSLTDGSVLNDHLIEGEAGTEEIPWALDFSMYCIDDILVCTTWVDGIIGQHPSLVDVVLLDTTSGRIVAVSNHTSSVSAYYRLTRVRCRRIPGMSQPPRKFPYSFFLRTCIYCTSWKLAVSPPKYTNSCRPPRLRL